MIKVDIVAPYLSGNGGMETVIATVVRHFENDPAYDVQLVMPQGAHRYEWTDKIQHVKINRPSDTHRFNRQLSGLLFLAKHILTTKAEIVICASTRLVALVARFRKLFKKKFKLVSWIHFSLDHEAAVVPKQLLVADYHWAISSGIKQQIMALGIPEQKIDLIYNPVSLDDHPIADAQETTEFIYVGRVLLNGQKNLAELVAAAQQLHGNWHFTIFGSGADLEPMKQLLAKQQLLAHFTFKGWSQEPWREVKQASALVLTSKYEGFPMVLVEAIQHGVPIISANCPTGPEDIVTVDNGFLYDMGDTVELANDLQRIIDQQVTFDRQQIALSADKFNQSNYFAKVKSSLNKINQR
ncbi:MAG: glycosyltransferase [Bacillota bacterium]|nr:glycosyltransferase [Bacillota bacterium]